MKSVNTNVAPAAGTVLKSADLVGNVIKLVTPETFKEGNALVSLYKDGEGGTAGQYDAEYDEILWSWHIWATNTDFNETAQDLGGVKMMDRNLGALSASIDQPGLAMGFHYQWGRPFPIIGGSAKADGAIQSTLMGTTNSSAWNFNVESSETTGTLAYSAQNPMTFIYASAEAVNTKGEGNWFYYRGETDAPKFWGEAKTMYDPSPVGWKVPGKNGSASTVWASNFTTDLTTWVASKGRYLNANDKMFYPACGDRGAGTTAQSGALNNVTSNGLYWSSTLTGER